ncbi:glutathione binding-like protein [Marilutibacter chinensis]|uniref:Glutathione binding-like protein n=1 Tax=Marilutibacter chinensis TaxID=2912247 RepID=A0ABS9HXI3_9GAMM|nr:glutathione binding-like protein [Lysobacter chinensis]MCF7222842.1 glutathione binding-like protein [Lysobacter chinensis]
MIDLYYWPTPNGHKITLFLEEAGLDYTVHPVDIGAGDQFKPEFLAISPNNKMPAIVDNAPADGGLPITVFESGAILVYLANKTGKFFGADVRQKIEVNQWLMWQMGGLGPMTGQYGHFHVYAPEPIAYARDRYAREAARLLGVLDKRLDGRDFLAGTQYTIADMACYPWIDPYDKAPMDLSGYPNLRRWRAAIAERPATARAYAVADRHRVQREMTEEMRRNLFGTPSKPD